MNPYPEETEYIKKIVFVEYTDIYGKAHTIRSMKVTPAKEVYYLAEGGCVQIHYENQQFVAASGEMFKIQNVIKENDKDFNDLYTLETWHGDLVKFQINYVTVAADAKTRLLFPHAPTFL